MGFQMTLTPKRRTFLTKLNLHSEWEVLWYVPRRYIDYTSTPLDQAHHDQRVVVRGTLDSKSPPVRLKGSLSRFLLHLSTPEGTITVIVFNRPYLYKNLVIDSTLLISGKWNHWRKEITVVDVLGANHANVELLPVYRLCEGVTRSNFQAVVHLAYQHWNTHHSWSEVVPASLRERYRLLSRKQALYWMHFAAHHSELQQALRTLKYEEWLLYFVRTMQNREAIRMQGQKALVSLPSNEWENLTKRLPFPLTSDQKLAYHEIARDMAASYPMLRLLQGDVGTGKTAVAMLAMLLARHRGQQAVFMAPTDLLARQHMDFLSWVLTQEEQQQVALLVGGMTVKEKAMIRHQIARGEKTLIVGTHALFQEQVEFADLGLAIIDEQHRFGVKQRQELKAKGEAVDLLLLSATPIPRTLAQTVYGDLDVSTLKEFPAQRRQVHTVLQRGKSIRSLLPELTKRLTANERIFLVCPLIDGDDDSRRSAENVYAGLQQYFAPLHYSVGLLHGKLSEEEKQTVMEGFRTGTSPILVATTVIEVGIDVPDASVMIIYDAERFGLAQLHQLRGRIGRAGQASVCYLLTESLDEDVWERLTFLATHEDGFEVAEYDLSSRGPGDLAGIRQSGLPSFRVADLFHDQAILQTAREDARRLLQQPEDPETQQLLNFIAQETTQLDA